MASTTSNTEPKSPPALPIETLKTDTARIYTHVHGLLVLSLYAYKFQDLVADPVPALLSTLAPLAVLQLLFVTVCLPPVGGTAQAVGKKEGGKKKAGGKAEGGGGGRVVVCCPDTTYFGRSTRLTLLDA